MATAQAAGIRGVVVSSETGAGLADVTVYVRTRPAGRLEVVTDAAGRFEFSGIQPGSYEILVSSIGYGLVKRTLEIEEGPPLELEVILSPGTHISTEVVVSATPPMAPTFLSASDIEQLRSVMLDDSVRSLQQLPSLVSNDDFNTGFASQGSGFDRVGILLDGIPAYFMLHTIEGLEDTGSTTLLSAELIEGIDFLSGGSSGLWGNNSAGFLSLESRSGNNLRWRNLLSVSGTALLFVSEGPVGNGSWLASGRKSYVDWIARRIEPESHLNFGFYDFFGKFRRGLGSNHQLSASFIYGNTGLNDVVEGSSITDIDEGRLTSSLFHLSWEYVPTPTVACTTHFYFQSSEAENENRQGQRIWHGDHRVFGARTAVDFHVSKRLSLNASATLERWGVADEKNFYDPAHQNWFSGYEFDVSTARAQLFAEAALQLATDARILAGWNWSYQRRPGQDLHSPYLGFQLRKGSSELWVSWGMSGQLPFFNQYFGPFGNLELTAEEARTVQASWRFRGERGFEVSVSGYHRSRDGVPWRKEGLWRLVEGVITPPSLDPFQNELEDRTYGGELRLGRRAPTGLSGWVGYAWSMSKWSEVPGVGYPGNYDQRNSLGLFALYRWSSQYELSTRWKVASGLPLPAYAAEREGQYYLDQGRNLERLPLYSRFDIRFGKTINKDRYRIVLFGEVLNLFNRENLRFAGHDFDSVNPGTGRIYGLTQKQFPILPTAGIIVEF